MRTKFPKAILIIFALFFSFPVFSQTLYKTNVIASYYGADFHGKRTSNGETFNMNALTCAHKTLPFNTILKVTNLSNGLSVQVRVNDRGPFNTREIDLSKAAAVKLDMIKSGTAKVKIEIVKKGPDTKLSRDTAESARKIMAKKGIKLEMDAPAPKAENKSNQSQKPAQSQPPKTQGETVRGVTTYERDKLYDIQVASFSERANAQNFAKKLQKLGFKNLVFQTKNETIRVVVSKVPGSDVAENLENLELAGYTGCVVRERKSN